MPLVPNSLAMAEDVNTTLSDIAAALTGSLASDGTTSLTGTFNANGHDLAGVGNLGAINLNLSGTGTMPSLTVSSGANINYLSGPLNANNQNINSVGALGAATINVTTLNASGAALVLNSQMNANNQNIVNVATLNAAVVNASSSMQTPYLQVNGNAVVTGATTLSNTVTMGNNANLTGNLAVTANVSSNAVWGTAGCFVGGLGDITFGMFPSGSTRVMQFSSTWFWQWENATGNLIWIRGNAAMWVMRVSDNICFNQLASVGGNGAYQNFSDIRGKTGIADCPYGLPQILQLTPILFTRLARAGDDVVPTEELGFSAQQVQPAIPHAVRVMGIELPDGTGGLDDPHPSLALQGEAILAAAVVAIQQLAARVVALEAR
jgi:hypothetical protein